MVRLQGARTIPPAAGAVAIQVLVMVRIGVAAGLGVTDRGIVKS